MDVSQTIKVGDWVVTPTQNLLERDGRSVKLRPLTMDVLVHLAKRSGDVVSADELINSVWQGRVVGDGTVYQCINQLRQALGDGEKNAAYIETIARRGYRLLAAVKLVESPGPMGRPKHIRSLVVLPLTNFSNNPDEEYFADGMTEALIANLANVRALKIISRTSAMHYKESDKSLPKIAEELDVDAVVEGSVLRAGQRVRIAVQLISATTDTHLWAESYERDVQDVLLLQSEVARAVTREIQVAVTPEEKEILASARRVKPEAYEAYLKGRFHYWKLSPEDLDKALEYYNLALEIDSDYALAYACIGDLWGARASFGLALPREAFSMGKPAALKAVQLDDQLADAHEILARFKLGIEYDLPASEKESRRAIALNPNNPDVGFAYWWLLIATKRFEEAMEQAEHALDLDPFNPTFQCYLGYQLLFEHRYNEAIAQFNQVFAAQPDYAWAHWGLCSSFHRNAMPDPALAEARQYFEIIGNRDVADAMVRGYDESGYQSAMRRGAEFLVRQAETRYVQAILIARLYAHAGESELSLDWLEKAFDLREPFMMYLDVDVDWDDFRDEPRFERLLEKFGLRK